MQCTGQDPALERSQSLTESVKAWKISVSSEDLGLLALVVGLADHAIVEQFLQLSQPGVPGISMFLMTFPDVPSETRVELVRRLEAEPEYNRKAGEHMIELLDRIDGHRKATMIGHAFAAYGLERIDLITLQRLNAAIE